MGRLDSPVVRHIYRLRCWLAASRWPGRFDDACRIRRCGQAEGRDRFVSQFVSFAVFAVLIGSPVVRPHSVAEEPAKSDVAVEAMSADELAKQVAAIAGDASLSQEAQGKAILDLVRTTVRAAVAGKSDRDSNIEIAARYAGKAAAAAPRFAPAIADAVASLPEIARIAGARAKVEAVVREALKGLRPSEAEFGGDTRDTVVSPAR